MTKLDYPDPLDRRLSAIEKHIGMWKAIAVTFVVLSICEMLVIGMIIHPQYFSQFLLGR